MGRAILRQVAEISQVFPASCSGAASQSTQPEPIEEAAAIVHQFNIQVAMTAYRLDQLPFNNSFAALPESHYTRLEPHPLPAPYLVAANPEVAELLGIELRRAMVEYQEKMKDQVRAKGEAVRARRARAGFIA